jgi:hypothetical protein
VILCSIQVNISVNSLSNAKFSHALFYLRHYRLAALQLFMPNLSLLGHLSGIMTGYFQLYGILDRIVMPSENTLQRMEQWQYLQCCLYRVPNFVATPSNRVLTRNPADLYQAVCNSARFLAQYIGYSIEAVKVIIFGRGSNANANIQVRPGLGFRRLSDHIGTTDDGDKSSSTPFLASIEEQPSEIV